MSSSMKSFIYSSYSRRNFINFKYIKLKFLHWKFRVSHQVAGWGFGLKHGDCRCGGKLSESNGVEDSPERGFIPGPCSGISDCPCRRLEFAQVSWIILQRSGINIHKRQIWCYPFIQSDCGHRYAWTYWKRGYLLTRANIRNREEGAGRIPESLISPLSRKHIFYSDD